MKQRDEMLKEYDFNNGIRGKYAQAYKKGVNIVKLDTDIMKFLPKGLITFFRYNKTTI